MSSSLPYLASSLQSHPPTSVPSWSHLVNGVIWRTMDPSACDNYCRPRAHSFQGLSAPKTIIYLVDLPTFFTSCVYTCLSSNELKDNVQPLFLPTLSSQQPCGAGSAKILRLAQGSLVNFLYEKEFKPMTPKSNILPPHYTCFVF